MATWSLVDDNFGLELTTPNPEGEGQKKYVLKVMGNVVCESYSKDQMMRLIQLLVMSSAEMYSLVKRLDLVGPANQHVLNFPDEGWVLKS